MHKRLRPRLAVDVDPLASSHAPRGAPGKAAVTRSLPPVASHPDAEHYAGPTARNLPSHEDPFDWRALTGPFQPGRPMEPVAPADAPKASHLALEPDAESVRDALAQAIAAARWEKIRPDLVSRESAAGKARARKRRAGELPELSGIGATTSVDAIAADVRRLQAQWSLRSQEQRALDTVRIGDVALSSVGVPRTGTPYVGELTSSGQFDRNRWRFNLREATFQQPTLAAAEAADLANLVAHEARHGEQFFLQARSAAGRGLSAPDIEKAIRVPPRIAAEAEANPLGPSDPRAAEATEVDQAWRRDRQQHVQTNRRADRAIERMGRYRVEAEALLERLREQPDPHVVSEAARMVLTLRQQVGMVETTYLAYRAIPYEADAHDVGDAAAAAFEDAP